MQRTSPDLDGTASSKSYRPDIDGLRAIAILPVVLFHAGVTLFQGGFVGVDVFFVISGYLIGAHVYADLRRGRFKIADFYRKRAKRILPALLVVLAFCYGVGILVLSPVELHQLAGYSIATILSGSNIAAWLKSNYFAVGVEQVPLLMTWSLGVEEQFYVVFPLLMIALARLRRRTLFGVTLGVTTLSLAACVVMTRHLPKAAFYLLPARAWELSLGILLAIYENGRDAKTLYGKQRFANLASAAGLLLIGIAVFLFDSRTEFPGLAALLPVCGAALLLSAPTSWLNRRVLCGLPLTFVGRISYSLYLWHWPLLSFAHIISYRTISATTGCEVAAISLVFAWGSYRFVEQRFRTSDTPSAPLLLRYAILCGLALLPPIVFLTMNGIPGRFPQLAEVEAARDTIPRVCVGIAAPNLLKSCVNNEDTRPGVALIGDSHAWALSPAIERAAHRSGYKFYEIIRFSCPPLMGVTHWDTVHNVRECTNFNAQVLKLLQEDAGVKVVILAGYWGEPQVDATGYVTLERPTFMPATLRENTRNLESGLGGTVAALRGAGKKVILIQDVPVFSFDPLLRMRGNAIPVRGFIASHFFSSAQSTTEAPLAETYVTRQGAAADVVRKVGEAQSSAVFDPARNLCGDGECRFLDSTGPLYSDQQHVTAAGSFEALKGLSLTPGIASSDIRKPSF